MYVLGIKFVVLLNVEHSEYQHKLISNEKICWFRNIGPYFEWTSLFKFEIKFKIKKYIYCDGGG